MQWGRSGRLLAKKWTVKPTPRSSNDPVIWHGTRTTWCFINTEVVQSLLSYPGVQRTGWYPGCGGEEEANLVAKILWEPEVSMTSIRHSTSFYLCRSPGLHRFPVLTIQVPSSVHAKAFRTAQAWTTRCHYTEVLLKLTKRMLKCSQGAPEPNEMCAQMALESS